MSSEETKQKSYQCVPKFIEDEMCGRKVNIVPHSCNGYPYLSISENGSNWELTGYLPEKDGMILGAAADLHRACEFALSILSRDGVAQLLGTAFTDTDVDVIRNALAKANLGKE